MPLDDRYGNNLTTTSSAARDHYVAGVDLLLGAQHGAAQAFKAAIAADPGFAMAHAGHARALMMAGQMAPARTALATAQASIGGTAEREIRHVAILSRLISGDASGTRQAVHNHVLDYPCDALVAQINTSVFGLIGFSGQTGREAALLAYTTQLMPHYGDDWWMNSMHALALCETGRLDHSLTLMERALEQNPANANAAHFKAHAQYEAGATAQGRAFLTGWLAGYDRRAILHGHLAWHVALWSLHAGDTDAMWAMVDDAIGPGASQGPAINVLTDTAAILFRAHLAGGQVEPHRWADLSAYAARFFPDTGQSFADIHAALAHAMAGDGDALDRIATGASGFAGDLVRPVATAWRAIARDDWPAALDALTPVMAGTERLGGSRAQRDLLEFTYANVLLKLGHTGEAARTIATRRPVFAGAVPVHGMH